MSKKVYLHVGFHKTGTTAIQESLFANSQVLEKLALNYVTGGGKATHKAAWALSGRTWGWKKRGGSKTPISEWEKALRKIKFSKKSSLLSSEFFSELTDKQLARLSKDLRGLNVQIIFTLRPLSKILPSSYQQHLKYGLKASYGEWLVDIFAEPNKSKLTPSFWKRHNHVKVIEKWVKVFGNSNIHLVIVDEDKPEQLYRSFEEILNIPNQTLTSVKSVGSNRSLSYAEISLLLAINKAFPAERSWADYELFIRKSAIGHLTNELKLTSADEKLLTPQWAIEKTTGLANESVAGIRAAGIKVYGDLKNLLSVEIPIGVNKEISEIPLATATSALLAFEKRPILNQYSSQEIFREAARRFKKIAKKIF